MPLRAPFCVVQPLHDGVTKPWIVCSEHQTADAAFSALDALLDGVRPKMIRMGVVDADDAPVERPVRRAG